MQQVLFTYSLISQQILLNTLVQERSHWLQKCYINRTQMKFSFCCVTCHVKRRQVMHREYKIMLITTLLGN